MKTSRSLRSLSLLGLLVLGAAMSGCTQVQVAPNTLGEYRMGELQVVVDRGFAATYEAAKKGMKESNIFQTGDEQKVTEGELKGRDSADAQVTIKVKEIGPNRSDVRIRYGIPGNLALAQKVYQSLQKQL